MLSVSMHVLLSKIHGHATIISWYPAMSWPTNSSKVQIKNIKLHIVTDIKVNFNSMFGFRISIFGWGDGHFY